MSIRNVVSCGTSLRNTGYRKCVPRFKEILGAFLVSPDFKLTAAQMASQASILTALQDATLIVGEGRLYPAGPFVAVTDNSEEDVFQTFGYGTQVFTRDGNYNWLFNFYDGGLCHSNQLRSHNGSGERVIFFDKGGYLIGTSLPEEDGTISMVGSVMDVLHTGKWTINDGTNAQGFGIMFSFEPAQINEDISFVKFDSVAPLLSIKGLVNAYLEQVGASLAGVFTLSVTAGCANESLYDEFSAVLATAANWVTLNHVTGLPIAKAVVANPGNKNFTITLDDEDPNYPATAPALIRVSLASPTVLAAADMVGYEGETITVQRG